MNQSFENRSPTSRRHQLFEDGRLLGFVDYHVFGNIVILTHTETNPELIGKGHGSMLAERITAHCRVNRQRIMPVCSFFAHFLRTHPEHHDILTPEGRTILEIDQASAG